MSRDTDGAIEPRLAHKFTEEAFWELTEDTPLPYQKKWEGGERV